MKYLNKYTTVEEMDSAVLDLNNTPNVAYCEETGVVMYTEKIEPDYLCFTALEDNSEIRIYTFDFWGRDIDSSNYKLKNYFKIEVSFDKRNFEIARDIITLNKNEKIYFRRTSIEPLRETYNDDGSYHSAYINTTGSFSLSGDIKSLINFYTPDINDSHYDYCFANLFGPEIGYGIRENVGIIDASELQLSIMTRRCYEHMFSCCKNLTKMPKLDTQSLADGCFYGMFFNCSSLENAEISAEDLAQSCFSYMFYGCENLKEIRLKTPSWSDIYISYDWTDKVASRGTFYKPASTLLPSKQHGIPKGWTVINE